MAKPVVDRLERDLQGTAKVVRIDVMSRSGLTLAREYGVTAVPTIIVFDGKGEVVSTHIGLPDRAAIQAAVAGAEGPP